MLGYNKSIGIKNEDYVLQLANSAGLDARPATAEEDFGYRKCDIVLNSGGNPYYVQVSVQPKSNAEQKKLATRGTSCVHTYKFQGMPLPSNDIISQLRQIIAV